MNSERMYRLMIENMREYAVLTLDPDGIVASWNTGAERDRLLAASQRAEQTLQRWFDQAPGFVALLRGPELVFEMVNHAYYQLVGHRELLGRPVFEALPEVRGQGFEQVLDDVMRTRRAFVGRGVPVQLQREPGAPLAQAFLDLVYEPVLGPDGTMAGIFVQGHDVTAHVLTTEALRASQERYRSLFESIDEGFCVIEMIFDEQQVPIDYRMLEINPAFERHTGLVGATGKAVSEIAPDLERHWFEIYGRVALTGEPTRFEQPAKTLGDRWFDVYAFRVGDPGERKVAILFNDISEKRRLVHSLQVADRRKDEFLAMLSHELRSPLAPLRNALRLLEAEPLGEHGRRALQIGTRQLRQMARLVDDLLEVSRITHGKIELRLEPVAIEPLVQNVIDALMPALQERRQRVGFDAGTAATTVVADPTRLAQVVENLLTNASKYGAEGGRIDVRVQADGTFAAIEVRDDGIGIEPADLPGLFELFAQVDPSGTRSQGGLGIGLSMVKRLVELHGGSVDAHSAGLGRGSAFTVRLPLARG